MNKIKPTWQDVKNNWVNELRMILFTIFWTMLVLFVIVGAKRWMWRNLI